MILKIKSFIYRFSNIFGYRLYLAKKEEVLYLQNILFVDAVCKIVDEDQLDGFSINLKIGLWHAMHGFTTIYVANASSLEAFITRVKHAFTA